MNNSQFPTARKTGLVVQEVPDEVLVYDLDTNKAHCLNVTASTVWKSCNGTNSISDIASILEKTSGSKVSDQMVWLAIDQLSENNLLEAKIKADFAGQTRREVLKKLGLATVVALPIVASLVAPKSAMAVGSCACGTVGTGTECNNRGCPSSTCCNSDNICAGQLGTECPPPPDPPLEGKGKA